MKVFQLSEWVIYCGPLFLLRMAFYVFESGSGFREGDTQFLSNELGREGLLIAIKLALPHQFCDQNPLIIYGIALSLLCDVLAPLRDSQE